MNGRLGQTCKNRGFSLTEVSLAVAIVSFTLLPMIGILSFISTSERKSRNNDLLIRYVDDLTKTLRQDSTSPKQFVWNFSDSIHPPLNIDYPQTDAEQTTIYFVGDDRGSMVRSVTEGVFHSGLSDFKKGEIYLLKVTILFDDSGAVSQLLGDTSLVLDISIESPVNVEVHLRKKELFSSRVF